jgi:uncharacterized protein (TIGR03000 family)
MDFGVKPLEERVMLKKIGFLTALIALGTLAFVASPQQGEAAGRGGFGGGGFRGGAVGVGGFRGGAVAVGGYRGGFVGGYRAPVVGFGGYRGGYYGGYRPYYGGYGYGYGLGGFGLGYGLGYGLGGYYPYGGVYLGGYAPTYYNTYSTYPVVNPVITNTVIPDYGYGLSTTVAPDYSAGLASAAPLTVSSPAPVDNSSIVTVNVPADAKVWFDGTETMGTGTVREFQSPGLTPGTKYHYDVKATWMENGKPVTQTRQVNVAAGARVNVDFATTPSTSVTGLQGK